MKPTLFAALLHVRNSWLREGAVSAPVTATSTHDYCRRRGFARPIWGRVAVAIAFGLFLSPYSLPPESVHAQQQPMQALAAPHILVNEVLPHTDPPQVDAVELYNPTAQTANIGGWCLSDTKNEPCRYRIPDGAQIAADGYFVLTDQDFPFRLSEFGEEILLSAADASGALTGYTHGFAFGASVNGVSFGRLVTSTGAERFPAQRAVTLGRANAGPLVGPVVIAELMYHPPDGGDEYLALVNISSATVPLYDPAHPKHRWQLTGIGAYLFPADVELLPGQALLLVATEPDAFRTRHHLASDSMVLGPFSGALSDRGERIALLRPDTPELDGTAPYVEVDAVDYDDGQPWPAAAANGQGQSLLRRDLFAFGDDPANWKSAAAIDGSTSAAATLKEFTIEVLAGGRRRVHWATLTETNAGGFTLWRSATSLRADALQVGGGTILAAGNRYLGSTYGVVDETSLPDERYTYWLQLVGGAELGVVSAPALTFLYLPIVAR